MPELTADQAERIAGICGACLAVANRIDQLCPGSREKSDALTNLDYVLSQAIAAITRRETRDGGR